VQPIECSWGDYVHLGMNMAIASSDLHIFALIIAAVCLTACVAAILGMREHH